MKKSITTLLKYSNRLIIRKVNQNDLVKKRVQGLKKQGYVILDNFYSGKELDNLQKIYQDRLEKQTLFETPCLSQSLINPESHKELINNYFKYNPSELSKHGITFDRSDFMSYQEVIEKFKPSTLKTYLDDIPEFFPYWLNESLLDIIESYMGLRPHLMEAYLRRNFPAKYRVMNHFWHRDRNDPYYLLKAFIFLTDCKLTTGPHEYVSQSVQDLRLSDKPYFSDEEVDALYPPDSSRRIRSIVKAGTVILEDTRGLHRATIPHDGYRDLGFAVFVPKSLLIGNFEPLYKIDKSIYKILTKRQRSYIPKECIYE
jgi:hypothetical protein